MSSSIEDDLVVLSLLKKERNYPILKYREDRISGIIKVYFTMSVAQFNALLAILEPRIKEKTTSFCELSVQRSVSEHVSEAERYICRVVCVCVLLSVAHGQSKRSANVPLTLTGKPNPAQITL